MEIIFHEKTGEFHLHNEHISYIMKILKNGHMAQLYFGEAIRDREDFSHLLELAKRPMSVCVYPEDESFSMEQIRQEYPSFGHGDMRSPAFEILQENGSRITDFVYKEHRIYPGKPVLEGLPATYAQKDNEAQTLEIILEDTLIQTRLVLLYTIFEGYPAVARSVRFQCENPKGVVLTQAMSMNLDLPDYDFEMLELTGAWARERSVKTRKLEHGTQGIYSMRGFSSHHYNPFLALKRPNTDEHAGEVYGFSLVYSGNFLGQVDVDTYGVARVAFGIHPSHFQWPLKAGESFQTPEAIMVYSNQGLNGMSQVYHELYRTRLARGIWRDQERPILINNWEATVFWFTQEKILEIAKKAKSLGVEMFVLDDGWFGKRDSDQSSLGDWYAYEKKLPQGIAGLVKEITNMGMKFGLWFEPEMVSEDSDLFRSHPQWRIETPGRSISQGRHQYVLDFSNPEVVDALYESMEKILSSADISYVKWDMNRSMSEVYSSVFPAQEQGTVYHRYILGVYRLYERLTQRFPEILFESCASGGGRFDPGMMYYAPQCWTSDNTDAVERLKIQYGTSMVYPISSMGSHVSAVPNHQAGRSESIKMRADVAYFGTFGYELDLNTLTQEEQESVKQQILFMKKYRKLIQQGVFYRLKSPFEGNETAWMVVSPDKKSALVGFYRVLNRVNDSFQRLKLYGLQEDYKYQVIGKGRESIHYGDELLKVGLMISDLTAGEVPWDVEEFPGDYHSMIYEIQALS